MTATQLHRPIQIATPLGKDVLLFYSLNGHERLGELFEYELELLSENNCIDPDKLLGENVTIGMLLPEDKRRYFNGYVTRFAQYDNVDIPSYAYYRATVRPWLWFLTRSSNCRIFQKKTTLEIVKNVCSEYGFTDIQETLSGSYKEREYCVQYRETDFNFINRLMEEEGIYYYFTHQNGFHYLVLADYSDAHDYYPGYAEIPYHPEEHGTYRTLDDHIYTWAFSHEIQTGTYTLNDYDFEKPSANLLVKCTIQRPCIHSDYEFFDYPGAYTETGKGDAFVRHRIEEHQARFEQFEGNGNARGLTVGYLFRLANFPREDQNREYLVISANFRMRSDAYSSSVGTGTGKLFECSFTSIDRKQDYRPPRISPRPAIHGAQTAMVVGPESQEIFTDQYGRVKVQFHWDRYGQRDENSSCWVRISQHWAGKHWGMIALPRIGQEVIVSFLEGDPDQPIITGSLYNANSMPPYELPKFAHITAIRSNSTKGGGGCNEISFGDYKGQESLFIQAEKNQNIWVKNDAVEYIGNERHLWVTNDHYELVDNGDKHCTVKGNLNETVGGTVSIIAEDMQAKLGMKVAIDSGQEIHLKAGINAVIEAGRITLKAGGSFIVVGPAGVDIVGPMVRINSGGAAGSGCGASPDSAKPPRKYKPTEPGSVDEPLPPPRPPKPKIYGPSSTILKWAAKNGTPFIEICQPIPPLSST